MKQTFAMPSLFPVAAHTDHVGPGSTFVAIKGQRYDGTLYIPRAIAKGAVRIVVEHAVHISAEIESLLRTHEVTIHRVENARKALAQLSAQAAGYPAAQLKLLGITGTKGKTTSVYILESLLQKKGYKVARLSTVANAINGHELPAPLTTPQPDYLHQFFALCVQQEVEYVVMEVAAQASTFNRLETLEFDGFIFTNLDREHAELYPTMEDYFQAKYALLAHLKVDAPLIANQDDSYGKRLVNNSHAIGFSVVTDEHHLEQEASYIYSYAPSLLTCKKNPEYEKYVFEYEGVPGLFNAYNLAGIMTLLDALNVDLTSLTSMRLSMPRIPGRLEAYTLPNGAYAYIDYAHTPGSFQSLLSVIRTWSDHVITIFGAGGGKDHVKRPLMGEIAARLSDHVIITSDNPRQEDPVTIAQHIVAGIDEKDKVIVELDRERAIKIAYQLSQKNSIIMLLGKGPDEYQIVGTKKIPFSERSILQSFIK